MKNTVIDAAIYEIDSVMNGGVEPGTEVPEFLPEVMEELRAIVRKLLVE